MNLQQQRREERSEKKALIGDNSDATDADYQRTCVACAYNEKALNTSPSLSLCLITADPQRQALLRCRPA
jgi:hypothetical protein